MLVEYKNSLCSPRPLLFGLTSCVGHCQEQVFKCTKQKTYENKLKIWFCLINVYITITYKFAHQNSNTDRWVSGYESMEMFLLKFSKVTVFTSKNTPFPSLKIQRVVNEFWYIFPRSVKIKINAEQWKRAVSLPRKLVLGGVSGTVGGRAQLTWDVKPHETRHLLS